MGRVLIGLMKLMKGAWHHKKNILSTQRGRCIVCGRATLFIFQGGPETIRNHAVCIFCRSSSRNRHIAMCVLNEYKMHGIRKLSDFCSHSELIVFNTSSASPIAKALGKNKNIICTEFFDDVKPGDYKDGVQNQDLQRLTFNDNSIDLIISEDVFEHVPNYRLGFKEVHRVLKKGGMHIFSIPFYFDKRTKELLQFMMIRRFFLSR
jgi:SAM-dependent methyltransferase